MPTACDFEEDAFQQQVDGAIGRLTRVVTTPGRVTEHVLGYDAAFFLADSDLSAVVGTHVAPHMAAGSSGLIGITVNPTVWHDLASINGAKIPPFRLNLFVQYKAPERLVHANAAQWSTWGAPYFRYRMAPHQLDVMNRIDRAGAGVLGCYCSPDFIDAATMWACTLAGSILDRAHFVRAQRMAGHGCYTYQNAKNDGVAFSEPERIEREDFEDVLARAIAEGPEMTPAEGILFAAKQIAAATGTRSGRSTLDIILGRAGATLRSAEGGSADRRIRLFQAIRVIRAFELLYRTRVLLVG